MLDFSGRGQSLNVSSSGVRVYMHTSVLLVVFLIINFASLTCYSTFVRETGNVEHDGQSCSGCTAEHAVLVGSQQRRLVDLQTG